MASTSLAEQLKKLAVPQSSIYKEQVKKPSLLFSPEEAGLKDRETFYEIGISGLEELIALDGDFAVFKDTLFSISSRDFERAVKEIEVNRNLDIQIEKFLLLVSPYLLLQSAHKALEWLVNRYQIHIYNTSVVMQLILPYHETKIFIRFIQIMNIEDQENGKWQWLKLVKQHGIALTKQILYNQCASSNHDVLSFIAKSALKHVEAFGKKKASQLNTIYAFFSSTCIGTINTMQSHKDHSKLLNVILPTLLKGLESPVEDFRSAAYIVLGFYSSRARMLAKLINDILMRLFNTDFDLRYDAVMLMNLIFQTQYSHYLPKGILITISSDILINITPSLMQSLCRHLKTMIAENINIMTFVKIFLKSVLIKMQKDMELFKCLSLLPEILLDEIDLRHGSPREIIKLIMNTYQLTQEEAKAEAERDNGGSDVEIIVEDTEILNWYRKILMNMERQYPDHVLKPFTIPKSKIKMNIVSSRLLGFKAEIALKVGDMMLFEVVTDKSPARRLEGLRCVLKNFHSLREKEPEFLRECLLRALRDPNPDVVVEVLGATAGQLEAVLTPQELEDACCTIATCRINCEAEKLGMSRAALARLVTLPRGPGPLSQRSVLAVMPHLFPRHLKTRKLLHMIIASPWGKNFFLTRDMELTDDYRSLGKQIFNRLCQQSDMTCFDDILDANALNKDRTIDVCFFLLLKAASFARAAPEDLLSSLDLLLSIIKSCMIVPDQKGNKFECDHIDEMRKLAIQDKLLFPYVEHILERMIDNMSLSDFSMPWCNLCETAPTVLVRRLYEVCVAGCFIAEYAARYAALLKKLLARVCSGPQQQQEFIANFACGHILYAADPKDVISPELQLRSLMLIWNGVCTVSKKVYGFDSDVMVVALLFCLNNPLAVIREKALEIIRGILDERVKFDKNTSPYTWLLRSISESEQEIAIDHEQLPIILCNLLEGSHVKKGTAAGCLAQLLRVLGTAPAHVAAELLALLSKVNSVKAYSQIVQALTPITTKINNEKSSEYVLNIYESKMMKNIIERFGENTVGAIKNEDVWMNIESCLTEYRACLLEPDFCRVSPAVLMFKQIDQSAFIKISDERAYHVVRLICKAGALSGNSNISSAAAKTMKRLHLQFEQFSAILQDMLTVKDPVALTNPKKKKSTVTMLSYQLAETPEWKLGVAMLEYVQSKKKMSVDSKFVSMLFQLLNRCLRFEEQSYVEYTKQLILSSLWFYCKHFVDDTDKDQIKALKAVFDIELIVQCVRNTQNPQTHHHALILLSHAACMLPEQALNHTMEIFTFMGTSVLRHDDAYSFQIIIKIIETLIPILIKLEKPVEEYAGKQLKLLQNRVVPVLRIFADSVLHVPEHRRLPLYKKLIETVGANHFMWVFLALLLETHVKNFNGPKEKTKSTNKSIADQEPPMNRTDFGQSILLEFPPEACIENFTRLITYMKSLPMQKDEDSMDTSINPSDIFSVSGHSALQLRHYKYVTITFMNSCLSSARLMQHIGQADDVEAMETQYKAFIINTLTYIQSISKNTDEKSAKYWRVMLHHCYDLLGNTNNLLSVNMFLSVVRGLIKHNLQTVRRKAMELLNSKIQNSPEFFDDCDRELFFSLLPPLVDIVKTIETEQPEAESTAAQELELNQQTALLSLKLLSRILVSENPDAFKPVLEIIAAYTCKTNISGNVMASVVLCLAELCGNLKAHALISLRKFMPALIKVLKQQREADTPELILLSTVTALAKIVESLPLFLSPYLQKILQEYAILLIKWQGYDQECSKVSSIVLKLENIKKKIASCIPPRVLIPVVNQTYQALLERESYEAIGPVMSVLADSFTNVTAADFTTLQQDLIAFFLSALQLRSDATEKGVDKKVIDRAEDEVVNALVCLVLKLSENNFRPLYFKVYDWAIRSNVGGQKDRVITFYRLSSAIAEKLKGLFVLFAGHFIKNSAELLDACNNSKTEELFFESEEKCIDLINSILNTLKIVFLYDSQNFLNRERFETLMQAIVDQLENTMGGIPSLKKRAKELIIPCISQFAVATADDSLWKLLNYQILLKTRHNDAEIRLTALDCLVAMATQLGTSWLPLLAESVPFLAELLEDSDANIEGTTKDAIRKLETILGEPLEKYF